MIRNRVSANLDKYLAYMDADGNVSYVPKTGNVGNLTASGVVKPNVGLVRTGSSNKGVTEEGAIIGDSKVNNSTFNNISTGATSKPSSSTKSDYASTATGGSSSSGSVVPSEDKTTETPSPSTGNIPSNQFSATYQGTDFLEWYKANYGTDYDPSYGFARKSGMSDVDWDIGNSLYDSYRIGEHRKSEYDSSVSDFERYYDTQIGIAEKNRDYSTDEATKRAESSLSQYEQYYNLSKDALDKSKRQSQQNASITLDKLKKYLPTQIKAQGLGGLGVSESTMLQAYNDYTSDMGTIESEYQKNKTDLETNYQDNRRSVESERDSAISAANNTYDTSMATLGESKAQALSDLQKAYASDDLAAWQTAKDSVSSIFDKYKEKFEEGLKQAYQDAYSTVSQSTETDESKILEYIEQFRGKLSDNDFLTLTQQAKQIAQANKKAYDEKEQAKLEEEQKESIANARETIKNAITEMYIDTKNLYDETTLTEEGYNRIRKYIEDNAETLGTADYKAMLGRLDSWTIYKTADRNMNLDTSISAMHNNSNYNSQLSQYSEALDNLENMRATISESDYNAYYEKITQNTCVDYKTYYVQGLGSGRKNDDIDITIGSTSRNKKTEYDLLCGDEVTNSSAKELLNKLTTGTASVTPANGTLCVVANKMYIYTKKGWRNVIGDHSDVNKAIADFLAQGKKNNTTTQAPTYASDEEIANKATSQTLTYNDVAKYNSGIRTASEFARANNPDKEKYGTYQAYLQAMYEKYKK